MKLKSFQVTNYRCIDDSGVVSVEPDVTCLVGKNESGKTALLQALRRINPDDGATFDVTMDYPRRRLKKYERRATTSPDIAVVATFELDDSDIHQIEDKFGSGIVANNTVTVNVDYENKRRIELDIDENKLVQHLINDGEVGQETKNIIRKATTLDELEELLSDLMQEAASGESADQKAADLRTKVQLYLQKPLVNQIWEQCLQSHCPRFMYFDHYRIMKGVATLDELANDNMVAQNEGLRTLRDLIDLAGTSPQELKNDTNYESYKANLEAAANDITDEVFEYWKQNTELEVEIDVHRPAGNNTPAEIHVRIKNRRHRVTVPFDERSRGFVWFFSFLAAFNKLVDEGQPLVILLDEPGLSLHASAQADLLRFIDERLVPNYQVIYTTHSPFMIDPNKLHRIRTVEDMDGRGTVVSGEYLSTDAATVFPLQAALGYDLAQTLFLGPNCLLVEGPSDLIYLQVMSEILKEQGKTTLDDRWVVVPVGGADKVATFVALLGANQLNIVVLLDYAKKDKQRIDNLVKRRLLEARRIVSIAKFAAGKEADIEDLLGIDIYLSLVSAAYPQVKDLDSGKLPKGARIVKRVEKALKDKGIEHFDHFAPARKAIGLLSADSVSKDVIERFESLFQHLNSLLGN